MKDYATALAEKLDEKIEIETTKLNVDVFNSLYLPYITGEKTHENFKVKWIELAGSPYKKVELVDNDGNVVDVVPPLMSPYISEELGMTGSFDAGMTEGKLSEETYGTDSKIRGVTSSLVSKLESIHTKSEWDKFIENHMPKKDIKDNKKEHSSSFDDEDEIELDF